MRSAFVLAVSVALMAAPGCGGGKNACWQLAEAKYECACVSPGVHPDAVITQATIDRWCGGDVKVFVEEFEAEMVKHGIDECAGAVHDWAQANLESGQCGADGYWECSLSVCDLTTY